MRMIFFLSLFLLFNPSFPSYSAAIADILNSFQQGLKYYQENDYHHAEKFFKRSCNLDADNPIYNHYLGKVYIITKQFKNAELYLKKVKSPVNIASLKFAGIKFNLSDFQYDYAFLHFMNQNYYRAIELYRDIIQVDASDLFAQYNIGLCYYMLQDHATANRIFKKLMNQSRSSVLNKYVEKISGKKSSEKNQPETLISRRKRTFFDHHSLTFDNNTGIITSLEGNFLRDIGIKTLREVFEFVPGLMIQPNETAFWEAVARGLPQFSTYDFIRIQINGVPLNPTPQGPNPIMDMNVHHIERLDIIRGAASALHQEYGYLGTINIVTKDKSSLSGSDNLNNDYNFDLILTSHKLKKKENNQLSHNYEIPFRKDDINRIQQESMQKILEDLKLTLNVSFDNVNDSDQSTGKTYYDESFICNDEYKHMMGLASLELKDFLFQLHYFQKDQGDYYGIFQTPPSSNTIREYISGIAIHRDFNFFESINYSFYSENNISFQKNAYRLQPEAMNNQAFFAESFLGDKKESTYYSEDIFRLCFNFILEKRKYPTEKDKGLAGYDPKYMNNYRTSESLFSWICSSKRIMDNTNYSTNFNNDLKNQLNHSFIYQNKRKLFRFTLTGRVRYDIYDNDEKCISPNIALVYPFHLKPQSLQRFFVKLQYYHGTMPSSLTTKNFFLLPTDEYPFSTKKIKTFEFSNIYNNISWRLKLKATLFYSEFSSVRFQNFADNNEVTQAEAANERFDIKGFEIEFEKDLTNNFQLNMNLSYADANDLKTNHKVQNSCDWLSNLILSYTSSDERYKFSLWHHYVGKRKRMRFDPREDLDGYHKINFTASIRKFLHEDIALQLSVKNLSNEDIRYPSDYFMDISYYPNDLPASSRQYSIKLTWEL